MRFFSAVGLLTILPVILSAQNMELKNQQQSVIVKMTVSGHVTDASTFAPISNATVVIRPKIMQLHQTASQTATTDVRGYYSIANIPANVLANKIVIEVGKQGYQPKSRDLNGQTQNFTLNPFCTLTGKVTYENSSGKGLSGAIVAIGQNQTVADSSGNYTLTNVPSGRNSITVSHQFCQTSTFDIATRGSLVQNISLAPKIIDMLSMTILGNDDWIPSHQTINCRYTPSLTNKMLPQQTPVDAMITPDSSSTPGYPICSWNWTYLKAGIYTLTVNGVSKEYTITESIQDNQYMSKCLNCFSPCPVCN